MRIRLLASILAIGLIPGLVECETPAFLGQAGLLDFIKDGTTKKQEITSHLGDPGATYDDGQAITYRLGHDKAGYYVMQSKTDWDGVCASLILVLDGNQRLSQHSLVPVNKCS